MVRSTAASTYLQNGGEIVSEQKVPTVDRKVGQPARDVSAFSGKQVAQVIDKTGITGVTKLLVFAAALGYLFDAFDNTIVGYVMPLISKDFVITPIWKGLLLSLALWGGCVGMWFWGPVSEARGRRFGFQGTVLSFSIFTGFAALSWSPFSFGVTRVVAGAGLAGFYAVDLAMVSEMTPTKVRGRLTSLITVLYPVGVILAGIVTGTVAQKFGWRAVFLVGVIPALCAYIVRTRVPESPRWLASKGRTEEAIQSLLAIGAKQQTIDEVRKQAPETVVDNKKTELDKALLREKFKELFSRKWLASNTVSWVCWITTSYAAWGVTLWLPTILVEIYHFTFVKGVMYLAITYAVGLLGRLCGVMLIDKTGRKPLIAWSFLAAAAGCLAFGMVKTPILLLCFIVIFKFFDQQAALGVMGYIPELYPTRLRVMGNAYAGAASRVAAALAPIMVGVLVSMHHYLLIWAIFAGVYVIGALTVWLLGPETIGKTLEELTESA
jgi:putative MFS transporter